MKNIFSLISCFLICAVLLQYRISNSDMRGKEPLKVTVWDAFGYYMYLPATLIYKDCAQLNWLDSVDKKYSVTGGNGWQAQKVENGNYVFKYLGGVAILELPLFCIGHLIAKSFHYAADGFSPPYQYALGFGIIFYCLLALLLLRRVLLYYFNDTTTAITLLLLTLATNFIQYAAIDNGQSHAYIFPLYVLILYTTLHWHRKPKAHLAFFTGYIIGLATMSRPTEAIMLFIPLFWDTHTRELAKEKWAKVKQHKTHIALAAIGGLLGILPQLMYWKSVTGSLIYDVGSKWAFLNPFFRVLVGWEKGWFIYTPITLFFIIGMFFMRGSQFRKSVLWFCMLNIYIIIAWFDWRYGGSYSTRALVQSYPVFALPLGAFIEKINTQKWRWAVYTLFIYLLGVNLFQVVQYNKTILHFNDMNRKYYARIYLNPTPTPADMSVLDSNEIPKHISGYKQSNITSLANMGTIAFAASTTTDLYNADISTNGWLKIDADIQAPNCLWQTYLNAEVSSGNGKKQARVRLFSPISTNEGINHYTFYVPAATGKLRIFLSSPFNFIGTIHQLTITAYSK